MRPRRGDDARGTFARTASCEGFFLRYSIQPAPAFLGFRIRRRIIHQRGRVRAQGGRRLEFARLPALPRAPPSGILKKMTTTTTVVWISARSSSSSSCWASSARASSSASWTCVYAACRARKRARRRSTPARHRAGGVVDAQAQEKRASVAPAGRRAAGRRTWRRDRIDIEPRPRYVEFRLVLLSELPFRSHSTKETFLPGAGFGTVCTSSASSSSSTSAARGLGLLGHVPLVGLVPEGALRQRHARPSARTLMASAICVRGWTTATTPSSRLDDGAGTRDDGALDRRRRPPRGRRSPDLVEAHAPRGLLGRHALGVGHERCTRQRQ